MAKKELSIWTKKVEGRNDNQKLLISSIKEKEITVAIGESGCGKTFISLHTALNLLGEKYKKIVLIKSVTEIEGEEIGFIPGDFNEKMKPYMMSFLGNIDKLCGDGKAEELIKSNKIQVQPIAYVRGITIDDSIVIIDEAQNIDNHTFKTIITRIGENSKFIFLGDTEQIDRKKKESSCLQTVYRIFKESPIVGTIQFDLGDCVRNPIIPEVLQALKINNI